MRWMRQAVAGLTVVGGVACSSDITDPDSTAGWLLSAVTGDATVVQGAAWAFGASTYASSDIRDFSYQNNSVNISWQTSGGATLRVSAPAATGTYPLVEFANTDRGQASVTLQQATGGAITTATGSVTIVRASVQSSGDQRLVDFAVTLSGASTPAGALSGSASACVDRHSTASCGAPIVQSGGSTGGTVGPSVCENSFTIQSLAGYYSAAAVTSPKAIKASGSRTTASTGDPAIVLNSEELIQGQVRYQVQLLIPSSPLRIGTLNVFDNNLTAALEGGGGVLVYSVGTSTGVNVTDSFRSNHDFGRNQDLGDIIIEELTPKLKGRFFFTAVGNGYPSLNQYRTQVESGRFCVNP
jgi:hypothetical protein